MVTRQVEEQLWQRVGIRSFPELLGFPFQSHSEFRRAVMSGHAAVGIDYGAARELAAVSRSPAGAYLVLALSWIPFLLAVASCVVPMITGRWVALGGVVTSLVGMALASPYNPLRIPSIGLGSLAVMWSLFRGDASSAAFWLAFSFTASCVAVVGANRLAWSWAKQAVLASEAMTAYLFRTGKLHVKDLAGALHSYPSGEAEQTETRGETPRGDGGASDPPPKKDSYEAFLERLERNAADEKFGPEFREEFAKRARALRKAQDDKRDR